MADIAETNDDDLLAAFYRDHWVAMGVAPADIAPDWCERALAFLHARRRDSSLAAFVAAERSEPVGCACCHLVAAPFPPFRRQDGTFSAYIWGVFVTKRWRRRGVGSRLVDACLAHAATHDCRRVLLHASEGSASLYRRRGFTPTDELGLYLRQAAP